MNWLENHNREHMGPRSNQIAKWLLLLRLFANIHVPLVRSVYHLLVNINRKMKAETKSLSKMIGRNYAQIKHTGL